MLVTSLPVRVVERIAGRLRFPALFILTAALFVVNLVVPDPLPFVDEILLGLVTLLLGSWKDRKGGDDGSNVETSAREP